MLWVGIGLGALTGVVLAALIATLLAKARMAALTARYLTSQERQGEIEEELKEWQAKVAALTDKLHSLEVSRAALEERLAQEQRIGEEKLKTLQGAETKLSDAFKALSADALKTNNQSFLDLARQTLEKYQQGARDDLTNRQQAIEQLTQPIRERLERFDSKLGQLEEARVGAYRALQEQVRSLVSDHIPRLHDETAKLVKALRQPAARGRWGEVQLRRVVEMAGMLEHCDFEEQVSQTADTGRLRPDMVVHLPGGRYIVVDAKTPIEAYLEAIEARTDEQRVAQLARHAQQVRQHVTQLGRKSYFEQFNPAPEFVVLFVPGEAFFSAALQQDPGLIEYGAEQKVIPASPTTLIALLKAVAYGWRQEALAKNAADAARLGRELYERLSVLGGHWNAVGQRLSQTVNAYNRSVGTLERRVMVSARRFESLGIARQDERLDSPEQVEHAIRPLSASEWPTENDPDHGNQDE